MAEQPIPVCISVCMSGCNSMESEPGIRSFENIPADEPGGGLGSSRKNETGRSDRDSRVRNPQWRGWRYPEPPPARLRLELNWGGLMFRSALVGCPLAIWLTAAFALGPV